MIGGGGSRDGAGDSDAGGSGDDGGDDDDVCEKGKGARARAEVVEASRERSREGHSSHFNLEAKERGKDGVMRGSGGEP